MNLNERIELWKLELKYVARKALGLPKYEECTLIQYSQYLRRIGYPEEKITEIIEAARKE